jgi:phosphoribosyl-ATP pyrophosphohydrolase
MGYHTREIKKGQLGEFSKIREEIEELLDAHQQNIKMLELCELCDLLGAIEAYVAKNNLTLNDLIQMKELTKSAFQEGHRK